MNENKSDITWLLDVDRGDTITVEHEGEEYSLYVTDIDGDDPDMPYDLGWVSIHCDGNEDGGDGLYVPMGIWVHYDDEDHVVSVHIDKGEPAADGDGWDYHVLNDATIRPDES